MDRQGGPASWQPSQATGSTEAATTRVSGAGCLTFVDFRRSALDWQPESVQPARRSMAMVGRWFICPGKIGKGPVALRPLHPFWHRGVARSWINDTGSGPGNL
jgi:hypothetical protein